MKSLKNHISLIIPLFAILFAAQFYLVISKIIKEYEVNLSHDYTIIVVATKPLSLAQVKVIEPDVTSLKQIESEKVIERLKRSGVEVDFATLKNFLPHFYQISLATFPSTKELQRIKEHLKKLEGVTRVETFTKTHEKIYNFLVLIKNISKLFLVIVFVTSIMLVFKQIEIWNLEHSERMYIMALFGAPLWMRIAILIKLSIVDTLIATLLVYVLYAYMFSTKLLRDIIGIENISFTSTDLVKDMGWLFLLGLGVSLVNVMMVSMRHPKLS